MEDGTETYLERHLITVLREVVDSELVVDSLLHGNVVFVGTCYTILRDVDGKLVPVVVEKRRCER